MPDSSHISLDHIPAQAQEGIVWLYCHVPRQMRSWWRGSSPGHGGKIKILPTYSMMELASVP